MSQNHAASTSRSSLSSSKKLVGVGVAVALTLALLTFAPVKQWLLEVLYQTNNLGPLGPALVAAFYVLAAIAFLPGSILTLGAGFLFGVPVGFITAWSGATVGACAAFMIGRTFARDYVAAKVSSNQKFMSLDEAIANEGFKLVFLLRLSPIFPYNFMNYALGLTKVSFRNFALASAIGMIPGALMYVYIGSAARSLAEIAAGNVDSGGVGQFFFWMGLASTVLVAILATRIAAKSLKNTGTNGLE